MFLWIAGVQGVTSGCAQVTYLREGTMPAAVEILPEEADARGGLGLVLAIEANARLRSLAEYRDITFPISIAKMLLSGLLVVTAGMALGGRPGSRSLAMQAIVANGALALLEYRLTGGMRASWIEAVLRARDELSSLSAEQKELMSPTMLVWGERMRLLAFDVGTTLLALLALLSRRSRAFFEAVGQAKSGISGEGT